MDLINFAIEILKLTRSGKRDSLVSKSDVERLIVENNINLRELEKKKKLEEFK